MSRIISWFRENRYWLLLGFLAILIISLSFGVGYLIAKQKNPAPIIIEKTNES